MIDEENRVDHLSCHIVASSASLACPRIDESSGDALTINGCPIIETLSGNFYCLFWLHLHILAQSRRTCRSCSKSIDYIIRRWSNPELVEVWIFCELHWLSQSCHSSWAPWIYNMGNWRHTQSRIQKYWDGNLVILSSVQRFQSFRSKFRLYWHPTEWSPTQRSGAKLW